MTCVIASRTCTKQTWKCESCQRSYCSRHKSITALGTNVECRECERVRLGKVLDSARQPSTAKLDALFNSLDIKDK